MLNFLPRRSPALLLIAVLLTGVASMPAVAATDNTAPSAAATSPQQVITSFDASILDVMKSASTVDFKGRVQKFDPVIRQTFDLPTMTKIIVGSPWNDWTAQQRQAIIEAFTKFVVSTYASRFNGYSGESFATDGAQSLSSGGMMVQTRLILTGGDAPVTLNYLMRQRPGAPWQIVDVFMTGTISELATRRSEFSAVLDSDGYQGLLDQLNSKSEKLAQPQ